MSAQDRPAAAPNTGTELTHKKLSWKEILDRIGELEDRLALMEATP